MRKIYRLSVVIAAAVCLAGCGGDDSDYGRYVTLGDYKNLHAELVTGKVTDEELEEYEKEQLDEYVSYEDVPGPVKEGLLVQVSLLAKDGDEIVYDFSDDGYDLIIGQQDFGPEVDEALTGGGIGDVLDFSVSYDDDFADAMLCGKEISYHMEIENISRVIYPELTDEFVKEEFGGQSVKAWREMLTEELRSYHQSDAEEALREELVQQVIDGSQFSGYPKTLYKQTKEAVQADYQSYADMFGCSLEEIYEMFDVDEEEREQEYLEQTYRTMALALIRRQENIALTDEQMQEKMEAYAQENEYDSVEELTADYGEESLKQYFLDEVTIDFLEDHADIAVTEE